MDRDNNAENEVDHSEEGKSTASKIVNFVPILAGPGTGGVALVPPESTEIDRERAEQDNITDESDNFVINPYPPANHESK